MSQNQIKWLAVVLMLIDHIGFTIEAEPIRIIGRLSFPLFAWVLARNWKRREPNSSSKPLMIRLLIFAIISQIPYQILFKTFEGNIMFSLGVVIAVFTEIHQAEKHKKIIIMILGLVAAQLWKLNYGWYAVACPLLMINLKSKGSRMWWIGWIITNVIYAATSGSFIQLFAILTPVILAFHNPAKDRKPTTTKKFFFYYFYPLHITGLAVLKTIL